MFELVHLVTSMEDYAVTGVHALVFTHALAGKHAFASLSAVFGSSVAGVVALCMSSGLIGSQGGHLLHSQMLEKSSGPRNATFYIPQCRKILVP
jgi:hypothetical protein